MFRLELDDHGRTETMRLLPPCHKRLTKQTANRFASIEAQEAGTRREAEDLLRRGCAGQSLLVSCSSDCSAAGSGCSPSAIAGKDFFEHGTAAFEYVDAHGIEEGTVIFLFPGNLRGGRRTRVWDGFQRRNRVAFLEGLSKEDLLGVP
jgi:hypothetical protein